MAGTTPPPADQINLQGSSFLPHSVKVCTSLKMSEIHNIQLKLKVCTHPAESAKC